MRSPATSRAELVDLLSCARAALRDAADPDPERSLDGATAFMDALVALGQTLALHPAWSRAEVRDFVRETAPHLAPAAYGFSRWVSSALALLEDVWESDEVERALRHRSAIEFARALYAAEPGVALDLGLDDALLRARCATESSGNVPPGIPPEHVWWTW